MFEYTAEGRARAKVQGRSLGRKPKLNAAQIAEAQAMQAQGLGLREIGQILGCDAATVSRASRAAEEAKQTDHLESVLQQFARTNEKILLNQFIEINADMSR